MPTTGSYWQEHDCRREGELHSGIRGIVWRAVHSRDQHDNTRLINTRDTRLLLNMTEHVMNNTVSQNENYADITEDIVERAMGFDTDITIPADEDSMNLYLKDTKRGIFGNMPREEVFLLGGHACVSLVGVMKHMNAGVQIQFTSVNSDTSVTRDTAKTHGGPAMEKLLEEM